MLGQFLGTQRPSITKPQFSVPTLSLTPLPLMNPAIRNSSRGNLPKSSGELNFLPSLRSALKEAASKLPAPTLPAVITKTINAIRQLTGFTSPESLEASLPTKHSPGKITTLIISGGRPEPIRPTSGSRGRSNSLLNTKAARSGDWPPTLTLTSMFSPSLNAAATGELLTPTTLRSSRPTTSRMRSSAGTATATTEKSFRGPATLSPTGSAIIRRFRCSAHASPPTSRSMVSWMKSLISSTMIRWNRLVMRQPQIRAGRERSIQQIQLAR